MALPPAFARAVDKAVAARMRSYGSAQTVSMEALAERERRLNEVYLAGHMTKADYDTNWRAIQEQRAQLAVPPAPLFQQQQQVLTALVEEWDGMTIDQRKAMLAAIFDYIKVSADGIDHLEPCEDWRPYVIAAIPQPVPVPTERKTGLYLRDVETARLVRDERGWLRWRAEPGRRSPSRPRAFAAAAGG